MILIDGYAVDVALREEINLRSQITGFRVESGGEVADHIQNEPFAITFEGVVTDSPIGAMQLKRGLLDLDGRLATKPSTDAYAYLLAIRARRKPVTIVCTRGTFESMALEELSINDSADTGDALSFVVTFKQIVIVTNRRVEPPTAEPRHQAKHNRGARTAPAMASASELPQVQPFVDNRSRAARHKDLGRIVMCDVNEAPPPPEVGSVDFFRGFGRGDGGF